MRVLGVIVAGAIGCGPRTLASEDASIDAYLDPIGCSDQQRDGFVDIANFPAIAACSANWSGKPSLRAPRIGGPCGDDLGMCMVPADACSLGWHVCGDRGDPLELTARITAAQCNGLGGNAAYLAAIQHCTACNSPCTPAECFYRVPIECSTAVDVCTEPVCCGPGCGLEENQCKGGLFPAPDTLILVQNESCGAFPGGVASGVLCCRD